MNYVPKHGAVTALYLSEHSEQRIYHRFPKLRLRNDFDVFTMELTSDKAEPAWAIPIHGGYIIGVWETGHNAKLDGYFVAQTALYNWQFKRSKFRVVRSVKVRIKIIQSQIEDKIRNGVVVSPEAKEAFRSVSSAAIGRQNTRRKEQMEKQEILKALRESVCEFSYKKTDGSIRQAVGTLRGDRIPSTHTPKSGRLTNARDGVPNLITYYDLDRLEWRSFHPSELREFKQTDISGQVGA